MLHGVDLPVVRVVRAEEEGGRRGALEGGLVEDGGQDLAEGVGGVTGEAAVHHVGLSLEVVAQEGHPAA